MEPIGRIKAAWPAGRSSPQPQARPSAPADGPTPIEGRALVAINPTAASHRPILPLRRAAATFVAHLIATDAQVPQLRARRRAAPDEAIAFYAAASEHGPRPGRVYAGEI